MSVTIGPEEPIVPANETVLLTNKTTSQFLGDEMGLALKSDVPTKTSQLDNDSDLATNASVDEKIGGVTSSIPTKTSQLENDSGFITVDDVPTKTSELVNDSDFATNASVDEKIGGVTSSIPTKVSQLQNDSDFANKDFVNSSIATNTANFKGTFNNESEFPTEATNNDYLFLNTVDENGNTIYKRYKFIASTSTWTYEYTLNNSSFTAEQWATINGGPYASTTDIPTKTSQLQNDSGFLDESDEQSFNSRIETSLNMANEAMVKCGEANSRIDSLSNTMSSLYATKEELDTVNQNLTTTVLDMQNELDTKATTEYVDNAIGNVLTQEEF